MSLFIGELAFKTGVHDAELRLGVLGASVAAALLGYGVLRICAPSAPAPSADAGSA